MARYPYRTDLKAPARLALPDFSDPRLAPAVRVLVKNLRAQVRGFTPPPGVRFRRTEIPVWDGAQMECFVLEPADAPAPLPGMLYCHGGGFFLPLQPMMLQLAAQYAQERQLRVYLPEYRFLPEHANPYPFRDCLSAWQWLCGHAAPEKVDPAGLLLYGESAGGTLAAGLALWQRAQGGPVPRGQLLIYPALDDRCGQYPSVRKYSEAAWPLRANLAMWRDYLKNGPDGLEEYLVPLRAQVPGGLPPAYIEPQEIDILHDEAAAYAARLRQAGNEVELNPIAGSYHGFDADVKNPMVQQAVRQRIAAMTRFLNNNDRTGKESKLHDD